MLSNAQVPSYKPLQVSGDIVASMRAMNNIVEKNGGIRQRRIIINNNTDPHGKIDHTKTTNLDITSTTWHMNQLGKTFITMDCKAFVHCNKVFTDPDNLGCLRVFGGLKDSINLLERLKIFSRNKKTGYENTNCVPEGVAYSVYKTRCQKVIHKYVHSLFENVIEYKNSVCGAYINPNVAWGQPNTVYPLEFKVKIYINDILALQIFDDWPTMFGDIVLKDILFTINTMVFAQVDPHAVAKHENFVNESITDADLNTILDTHFKYDRKFTQGGMEGEFITQIQKAGAKCNYITEKVRFTVSKMEFDNITALIPVYNCTDRTLQEIQSLYPSPEQPWIIPAQSLDIFQMPPPTDQRKYNNRIEKPLNNVTDLIPVFYKDTLQTTCFENPMVDNLEIFADGKCLVDTRLSTIGEDLFGLVLQSADLEGVFECTKELEDSLTTPLNNTDGSRKKRTYTDCTSFLPSFTTQRYGKHYFYDGLETGSRNANIQLIFDAIHQGAHDTYLWHRPPAPQIWACRSTYWSYDNVNGLKYHNYGVPPGYESDNDKNLLL